MTPQAKAVVLFDACLKRQGARLAREEQSLDDDWCFAGFMPKLSKTMQKNAHTAKAVADARVYANLSRSNQKISFVYDFCDGSRSFSSMTYVANAARHPLQRNISSEEFANIYGLTKELCFHAAAERAAADDDWWSALYASP